MDTHPLPAERDLGRLRGCYFVGLVPEPRLGKKCLNPNLTCLPPDNDDSSRTLWDTFPQRRSSVTIPCLCGPPQSLFHMSPSSRLQEAADPSGSGQAGAGRLGRGGLCTHPKSLTGRGAPLLGSQTVDASRGPACRRGDLTSVSDTPSLSKGDAPK